MDTREIKKRRREWLAIASLSILFLLLTVAEFRLTRLSTTLPFVNSIFFFGILNVNIILLIAIVWLVFRNIGKLFIERSNNILGSRLKTKLVAAFLAFSIIPTLVLFVISAMYINSSFDKWFSIKIQNTLQASLEITETYYRNTRQSAMHFAEHLSTSIGRRMGNPSRKHWLQDFLKSERELLALDAIEFYSSPFEERVIAQRNIPGVLLTVSMYPRLPLDFLDKSFAGESLSTIQHIGSGDLIRYISPVFKKNNKKSQVLGVVVVSSYIPVSLVNKVDEIASVFDDYKETNPLKYPMKTTYFVILVMITLVIIFVAMWIGLHMAQSLTDPVERLVFAAQAIGAGNLDVSIQALGNDEISVLIRSFNKMTQDLKENRERLTKAGADLEERRLQLEAVLTHVGTGVIAVDSHGVMTTFNRAVSKLLELEPQKVLGMNYKQALVDEAAPLAEIIERAFQEPSHGQWNHRSEEGVQMLAAVATPLSDGGQNWGVVTVIDDMSHIVKAQREVAWREVARRIAHEIKNPLTPIKLSAQRLQRRFLDFRGKDSALLKECTDTIIKHSDELKEMVNEFSNFARFPEVSPSANDLNEALGEVVSLFMQAHPEIQFEVLFESRVPVFEFDRDQIKRVLMNLLSNAIAALKSLPTEQTKKRIPKITVATHYNEQLQIAVLEVVDNGPGMTKEVESRVFEPYFSTRTEGTGLGLAIVKRIVNDHDGFIRVYSTPDHGTKFLIELPTSVRHVQEQGKVRFQGQEL